MSTPPSRVRGQCILWSREAGRANGNNGAPITVRARHAELPQVVGERTGGWRTVNRPGLLPITTWDGSQPLRVQLVLIFDGLGGRRRERDVVGDLRDLRLLTYRVGVLGRPPTLRVIGAVPFSDGGIREEHQSTPPEWVIEELEIEELAHLPSGDPAVAKATVTLLEHIPATIEQRRLQAQGRRGYKWRKGDTLSKVAREKLGDSRRAQWIRDANPKITKQGWSKVKVGTRIVIPKRLA